MKVVFLVGERALRERYAKCIESADVEIEAYPTAAKALVKLETRPYDLVAIHWKAYPGFASGDPRIDELAELIPATKLNQNVLYWEVALCVIDALRAEDSPNQATPVIAILPVLGRGGYGTGDDLTIDSVESDIAARQPAQVVYGTSASDFANAASRYLGREKDPPLT